MTEQTWWALVIAATLVAAAIGFFVGRQTSGVKKRVGELESELRSRQEELDAYKQEVESHFDKTATLFVSMAGSYKDLFEHLTSGYEKLSAGSARDLFKGRFSAVLLDDAAESRMIADSAAADPADPQSKDGTDAAQDSAAIEESRSDEAPSAESSETPEPAQVKTDEAPASNDAEPAQAATEEPAATARQSTSEDQPAPETVSGQAAPAEKKPEAAEEEAAEAVTEAAAPEKKPAAPGGS